MVAVKIDSWPGHPRGQPREHIRRLEEHVRGAVAVEGCHSDGIDLETWAAQGLVDMLIIGTRTINVDVASFRKAVAGGPVKLLPSFDCFHATDGYHGDQSLDLLCGVFGNYLHQGADGVGIFNNPAGYPEHAKRLGLTQQANYAPEILTTIGSLKTIAGKPRYYAIERRGGYAHNEGYGSSNSRAPLPVTLRYDGTPSTLTLPVWEPVKPVNTATLRLVLFDHVEGDGAIGVSGPPTGEADEACARAGIAAIKDDLEF